MKLRLELEYWKKVKDIKQKNLVFLDQTGVLLGLTRTHARSERDTISYAVKPFYRGKKVTVIGAISLKRVVALMTMDNSMDSQAFEVFIEKCLVPQLWSGAVVVMDNLYQFSKYLLQINHVIWMDIQSKKQSLR
jgi:hypothetical protein